MSDNHQTNGKAPAGEMTTSRGVRLVFKNVPPLLISKLQSQGTLPPVPTRKIPLDFGDGEAAFQEEELSENDLLDEDEKRRWAKYVKERDAILTKRSDNVLKALFAKGVDVDMSHVDEWRETLEYLEIPFPESTLDQKVQYIQTEALGTPEELSEVIIGVLSASGLQEEELEGMRNMFRRPVRRSADSEAVDAEGQVEVGPEVHGDGSSPLLGSLAS